MTALIGCSRNIRLLENVATNLLYPCINATQVNLQIVRHRKSKHWDPKFKKLRTLKVMKVDLPDFREEETIGKLSEQEIRAKMKEKGILPPRPWMERPFFVSCTGAVFEPYVPPEGDGKISAVTLPGAKQKIERIQQKSKSMMAVRKVRNFDEDFEPDEFVDQAQEIYLNAHKCLSSKDKYGIREYITERAYPEMMDNARDKTIHWKFLQSLEPPRVVHVRVTDLISKENMFAQITVRFHTQQILAIYDRFGRLMYGSEIVPKDVLEYIVFEKHLSNQYGLWRLHGKIIPDWMPPKEPLAKTFVQKEMEPPPEPDKSSEVVEKEEKEETVVPATA